MAYAAFKTKECLCCFTIIHKLNVIQKRIVARAGDVNMERHTWKKNETKIDELISKGQNSRNSSTKVKIACSCMLRIQTRSVMSYFGKYLIFSKPQK